MTPEILLLLAGGVVGFWAGRVTAEVRRAKWDMSRVWSGRKNYRRRR